MSITVALRQLVEPSAELKSFLAVLSEKLETKGATVILLPPKASDGRLLKMWQVQAALAFTQIGNFSSEGSISPGLRFYYCSKRQEESLGIIAAIVREMLRSKEIISYGLAGRWEHWKKLCYYNFLTSAEVPSVLIELQYFELNAETISRLTDWIINGLNHFYGQVEAKEAEESTPSCQSENSESMADSLTREEDGFRNVPLSETTPYSATEEKAEEQTEEKVEEEEPEQQSEEQKREKTEEQTGEQTEKNAEDDIKATSEEKTGVAAPQTPTEAEAGKSEKNETTIKRPATANAGPAATRVGSRRRYRGGNPLAPPGDGPIYFFERKAGSPELPPLISQLWTQAPRPSAHGNPAWVKNVGQTGIPNRRITFGQESVTNAPSQLKKLASALLPPVDAQSTLEDINKAPS